MKTLIKTGIALAFLFVATASFGQKQQEPQLKAVGSKPVTKRVAPATRATPATPATPATKATPATPATKAVPAKKSEPMPVKKAAPKKAKAVTN